jgi:hypothetical protein
MQVLHLNLREKGNDSAQFHYYWDNPNKYLPDERELGEIFKLIEKPDTEYYTRLPLDYAEIGKSLYNWLNGDRHLLDKVIKEGPQEGTVLAITTWKRLSHLPWELLHNGRGFLVDSIPPVVPIRWVPELSNKVLTIEKHANHRALSVAFMPASPHKEQKLDLEAEERSILEANKQSSFNLEVEYSGCLTNLKRLVNKYDKGFFDVLHLTGHAAFRDENPCFITETESGESKNSNARDIADALQYRSPKLIFLSGCRTGYSWDTSTPSIAENLVKEHRYKAVLGWGDRVLDTSAIATAKILYENLSLGNKVTEALAKTYRELIKTDPRGWHLLRLYATESLPGALVTAPGESRREAPTHEIRIPPVKNCYPQLKRCIQALKQDSTKGVLILGEDVVASPFSHGLCERLPGLPGYKVVKLNQQIYKSEFVNKLAEELDDSNQRDKFLDNDNDNELKYLLKNLFEELRQAGKPAFIFVFNNFKYNLNDKKTLETEKVDVRYILEALIFAIKDNRQRERLIITCRYDFNSDLLKYFYKESLETEYFVSPTKENKDPARDASVSDGNSDDIYLKERSELPKKVDAIDKEIDKEIKKLKLDNNSLSSHNNVEYIPVEHIPVVPQTQDPRAKPIENTKYHNKDDFEQKLLDLKKLLEKEEWKKADKKTSEIMRKLARKQREEDWGTEDFDKFPCCFLCKIDKLWQEYSDQKFGFSIQLSKWRKYQKKIAESFDVIKYQKKFAESVGWYRTNKWLSWADQRFRNNAKMKNDGLLPIPPPFKKDMSHSVELMPQLAKKIEECQGNHFCSED